jgi:hypothetical protein
LSVTSGAPWDNSNVVGVNGCQKGRSTAPKPLSASTLGAPI